METDKQRVIAYVWERSEERAWEDETEAENIGWCLLNISDVEESVIQAYAEHLRSRLRALNARSGRGFTMSECLGMAGDIYKKD